MSETNTLAAEATTEKATGAVSKGAWKKAGTHTVTLPSGAVVDIRIPNLTAMAKSGQLPNSLLELVANKESESKLTAKEELEKLDEFHRFLVPLTVVEPSITEEDFDDIPPQDVGMLVQFATRQIDIDAVGHQLGGLETIKEFRRFRGLDDSLTDILGA